MAKYPYARDCSGILRTNPPYPRPITQRYYSAYLLVPLNSRDTKTTTEKKSGIRPYTTGNLVRTSIPEKNDFIRFFLFLEAILHRQTRTALYLLVKRKELFAICGRNEPFARCRGSKISHDLLHNPQNMLLQANELCCPFKSRA